jgi:hypothetical protein
MRKLLLVGVLGAAATLALSAVAMGGFASHFGADLDPVPHDAAADRGSNVQGQAQLTVQGTSVHVVLHVRGLSPNLPHAMHIHGELAAQNECPPASADVHGLTASDPPDGLVDLGEGAPFYGPIQSSFTTTGDTSPASGLALERFPVADSQGHLDYDRTFEIPQDVIERLGSLHIVVHGLDLSDDGVDNYDGNGNALFEATLPVACGQLVQRGH